MAKTVKSSGLARSTTSGQFVPKDSAKSAQAAKTAAASALSQRSNKTSSGSARVIKDVSTEHREALKRLVDR